MGKYTRPLLHWLLQKFEWKRLNPFLLEGQRLNALTFIAFAAGCVNLPQGLEPIVENVCRRLEENQELITMFSENPVPKNCRSSLEGVWHFAYQNRYRFTGECNHPDARISSCQAPGTQFLIENQKFNISYRNCIGMQGTFDGGQSIFFQAYFRSHTIWFLIYVTTSGFSPKQLLSTVAWGTGLWAKIISLLWWIPRNPERMKNIDVSWRIGMMIFTLVSQSQQNVTSWSLLKEALKGCDSLQVLYLFHFWMPYFFQYIMMDSYELTH